MTITVIGGEYPGLVVGAGRANSSNPLILRRHRPGEDRSPEPRRVPIHAGLQLLVQTNAECGRLTLTTTHGSAVRRLAPPFQAEPVISDGRSFFDADRIWERGLEHTCSGRAAGTSVDRVSTP